MRIVNYHKKDQQSVIGLPTPLELFKESHIAEEYDELMSFYQSEEWQEVERESLNSDRRYYEGRKIKRLPSEEKTASDKPKFYDPEPFQLRIERKLCKSFEDVFDDPVLRSCVKALTVKQKLVLRLFCQGNTYVEIAWRTGFTLNNVSKLKVRAMNSVKADYAIRAPFCDERIPYNIKWQDGCFSKQMPKKSKQSKHKKAA